jgi:hypothetical protein
MIRNSGGNMRENDFQVSKNDAKTYNFKIKKIFAPTLEINVYKIKDQYASN